MTTLRPLRVVATVLVYNNPSSARRVVESLRAQSRPVDEIVIVDNGSSIPLIDAFKATDFMLQPDERLVRSDSNRGVGGGHNLGINFARSLDPDLIWILEHDSFADWECLATLLALVRHDDTVVAAPLVARNEYERALAAREPLPASSASRSIERGHALTFNGLLVWMSLLDRIGPLREDLKVGLEDRDFVRRLAHVGGRIVRPSRTLMIHPTRGNNRFPEPVTPERLYYATRNALLEQRECGERPAFSRVARTLGAAGYELLSQDLEGGRRRLRGLRDGLRQPVAPRSIDSPRHVQVDVVHSSSVTGAVETEDLVGCRACGETSVGIVLKVVSWRSLPERFSFSYGECAACGSLTLRDDVDPSDFYNAAYDRLRPRRISEADALHRAAGRVGEALARNPVTARLSLLDRHASSWYLWFRASRLTRHTPILDVGCGNGAMLGHLRSFGFTNLTGIDPFLVSEMSDRGLRLCRGEVSELPPGPQYGLVLFNHSLEHVDDPVGALSAARSRLLDGGRIVVRVPVVGGAAWRRYRENLWSLDAPLHRFVPTPAGVERLAGQAGCQVIRWMGESAPWFYLASELIRRGINPEIENPRTMLDHRWQRWADRAARRERGPESGQATFVLGAHRIPDSMSASR